MNKLIYIFLLLPILLLSACEKDTAPEATTLEISTDDPTDYGRKSITLNGTISDLSTIKEAGFLFWKSGDRENAREVACTDLESGKISVVVDGLDIGMPYLYCLYVGNGVNRKLSTSKSFSTPRVGAPQLSKITVEDDTRNIFSAFIQDDGIDESGKHIVAKGLCWNREGKPTVFDDKVVAKSDDTDFTEEIGNLLGETYYYFRAFAQNDSSYLAYGPELKVFIKRTVPTLGDITMPDSLNKIFQGKIIDEGKNQVTAQGFCWNTTGSPSVTDNKMMTDDKFIATLDAFEADSLYYIRAFAQNKEGYGYSPELSFKLEATIPVVGAVERIDSIRNVFKSSVINDGGSKVTTFGFCWNTTGQPTLTDNSTEADALSFTATVGDLEPGTYYVRAYAQNSAGTGYGDESVITIYPKRAPVIGNIEMIDLTNNTFVASDIDTGNSPVTEVGFCWNTTGMPTIYDYSTQVNKDNFSVSLRNLQPGTYYIRAYAQNAIGTGYSQELSFTIKPVISLPTIGYIERIDTDKNIFRAYNLNNGNDGITRAGFCWNTTGSPTSDDYYTQVDPLNFTATIEGWEPGNTYYIRAYAQNSAGTGYSPELIIEIPVLQKGGIYTLQDLMEFRDAVNNNQDISNWKDEKSIVNLYADIDMAALSYWDPISKCNFVFEGNNHTISNINLSKVDNYTYNLGLFGLIENTGIVRNLIIGEGSHATNDNADDLYFGSICGWNKGLIENCRSYCSVSLTEKYLLLIGVYAGGISGKNEGTIKDCTNYGNITSTWQVGGISGWNNSSIENSKNYGAIHCQEFEGGEGAHGIAGNDYKALIFGCTNHGDVSSEGGWSSGIGSSYGTIKDCINFGKIAGTSHTGGIAAGAHNGLISNCTNNGSVEVPDNNSFCSGGISAIVGWEDQTMHSTVQNCKNTGAIKGTSHLTGNIAGKLIYNGIISGCIYGGTVNGVPGTKENAVGVLEDGGTLKSTGTHRNMILCNTPKANHTRKK